MIGNGGDVVDRFLEASRAALITTLAALRTASAFERACAGLPGLDPAQEEFCGTFLAETATQMEGLNGARDRTPFLFAPGRLHVPGPDGTPRQVLAVTPSGPAGAITFDADGVRLLAPRDLLALLVHEFGHKVTAASLGAPVVDDAAYGPFPAPDGGRRLLDAVGAAVARAAAGRGVIGTRFGVNDGFHCTVRRDDVGLVASSRGFTPRAYAAAADYRRYVTGVGTDPRAFQCFFPAPDGSWEYAVRLGIEETRGCVVGPDPSRERQTTFVVERVHNPGPDGTRPPTEIVATRVEAGVNPLCVDADHLQRRARVTFEDGGRTFVFEVKYEGSYSDAVGEFTAAPLGRSFARVP